MTRKNQPKAKKNFAEAARRIAAEVKLPDAAVIVPNADVRASRMPFFATGVNKPCNSMVVPPTCKGKANVKLTPKKLGLNRPTEAEYKAACKRAGGSMEAGYEKSVRAGKVDLNFLSKAQAAKLKTLPGPNLRLCVRDNEPGPLIPVSSPEVAADLQKRFAACTKGNKALSESCARKVAGKTAPLGSLTSRRTFAGLLRGR